MNERFYELVPVYRDYKSAADVVAAFKAGKDFRGDYQLNFKYCSIRDFAPGDTIELYYKGNSESVVYIVVRDDVRRKGGDNA